MSERMRARGLLDCEVIQQSHRNPASTSSREPAGDCTAAVRHALPRTAREGPPRVVSHQPLSRSRRTRVGERNWACRSADAWRCSCSAWGRGGSTGVPVLAAHSDFPRAQCRQYPTSRVVAAQAVRMRWHKRRGTLGARRGAGARRSGRRRPSSKYRELAMLWSPPLFASSHRCPFSVWIDSMTSTR